MVKESLKEVNKEFIRFSESNVALDAFAPCRPDGEVETIEDDTKEAVCYCNFKPKGCLVDGKNRIIS